MNCQFLYDELFLLSLPAKVKRMMDDDDNDGDDDGDDDDGNGNGDVDDEKQDPKDLSFFGRICSLARRCGRAVP